LRQGFRKNLPLALLVGGIVIVEMAFVLYTALGKDTTAAPELPADYANTAELGKLVYTQYVYPFEIAAVLLVVAIIAAIALT
jgi:NADH-quinone oxidoreductase subunit J